MKLHFQSIQKKLGYQKQVGLQPRHVKYICDANSIYFASCFNSNNNGSYFDGFGHAIIIQMHVLWRNYLIDV